MPKSGGYLGMVDLPCPRLTLPSRAAATRARSESSSGVCLDRIHSRGRGQYLVAAFLALLARGVGGKVKMAAMTSCPGPWADNRVRRIALWG